MSAEELENTCAEHRAELVRLMCKEVAEPSTGLRSHLAECEVCRAALEAARELVPSLRAALQPEPLSGELVARIHARLDALPARRPARWSWRLRVGIAAAAAVLAAVSIPRGLWPDVQTGEIVLSEEDAMVIAQACGLLDWDGSVGYSVEYLSTRIEEVAGTVERAAESRSLLPWGPEDDWDMPVSEAETSEGDPARPTWVMAAPACVARRDS